MLSLVANLVGLLGGAFLRNRRSSMWPMAIFHWCGKYGKLVGLGSQILVCRINYSRDRL